MLLAQSTTTIETINLLKNIACEKVASLPAFFHSVDYDQIEQIVTSHKSQVTSLLLSDGHNDTGSDWALKFLGQGTAQQPTIT